MGTEPPASKTAPEPARVPTAPGLWNRVWHLMSPRLRRRVRFLVPLLLLGSLFELVGISAFYPVLLLLFSPDWTGELQGLLRWTQLLGLHPVQDSARFRTTVLWTVGVIFFARTAYLVWLRFWIPHLLGQIRLSLAEGMLERYLAADFSTARERTTSRMQHLISHQTYMVTFEYLFAWAEIGSAAALALGVFLALVFIDPILLGIGAVALGVAAGSVWLVVSPISRRLGERYRQGSEGMLFEINQAVGGIRETKLMQRGPFFLQRFRVPGRIVTFAMARQYGMGSVPPMLIEAILAITLLLALGLTQVGPDVMAGLMARFGMLVVAILRFIPIVNRALRAQGRIKYAETSVRTYLEELEALGATQRPRESRGPRIRMESSLEGRKLSFAYRPDRPVLQDVDLRVERGEMIAFVGASGAGKSTLVDLLCGLLRPTSGDIAVDGVSIRGQEDRWWPSIGYVHQGTFLLDASLEENVAFGLPFEAIDRDRVLRVLQLVRLSDLVDSHPDGLRQSVGERGSRLSGGQRQRIGIARALYLDADVLILDEATANLDAETEAAIAEVLTGLRGQRTVLIIAHRLHAVQRVDRVVFMDAGRVVRSGSFDDVRTGCPAFARMVDAQRIEAM